MEQINSSYKEDITQKVGFVVVNYNNYEILGVLLENFLNLDIASPIVIIDNSENPGEFEKLRAKYEHQRNILCYQTTSNQGYSKGNNLGIKILKEQFISVEFIAIINPDVIFTDKHSFYEMIQYYIDNFEEIGIITGVQYLNGEVKIGSKIPGYWDIVISRIPFLSSRLSKMYNKKMLTMKQAKVIDVGVVSGCFFVIAYQHFKEIGFFDENIFLYFEENIISKKLKKSNLKVSVYKDFSFDHNHKWKKWDMESLIKYNENYSVSEKYYVENYLNKKKHYFYDVVVYLYTKFYLKLKGKFYY